MIDQIIVQSDAGIITQADIDRACEEYKSRLPDPDRIYKNVHIYTGMLEYVYYALIDKHIKRKRPYDVQLLDAIFQGIYIPLTHEYGYTINVLQYCILVHIEYKNIRDIVNGVYRYTGNIPSNELRDTIKKWFRQQEADLAAQAVSSNGIGAIFALKAVHSWQDAQTVTIQAAEPAQQLTVDELQQIAEQDTPPEEPPLDDI